jgi:hypothetical protein
MRVLEKTQAISGNGDHFVSVPWEEAWREIRRGSEWMITPERVNKILYLTEQNQSYIKFVKHCFELLYYQLYIYYIILNINILMILNT